MGTPKAKAVCWGNLDAEARKRGEQKGLDTLVVHALNFEHWLPGVSTLSVTKQMR